MFFKRKEDIYDIGKITQNRFIKLYDLHAPKLYGFFIVRVKNEDIAKDLVQDVFRKAWENRDGMNPKLPAKNYLITIAKNLLIDFYRKRQTEKNALVHISLEQHSKHTPEELLIAEDNTQTAMRILKQFPKKTREIFLLSRKRGMTNKEIATSLSINEKTVEYHISKALKEMRVLLPSK